MTLAALAGLIATQRAQTPQVGEFAPGFTLKRMGSKENVSLADFKGKRPVVLIFGSYT
ncbi:MAG: hypothetical protein JNM28_08415 [Armatimonadetes bacterium]|nr:hypothetical protein [Armatimonadota bacterium]MBS1710916.1 hypothetical protein [Armatimonadota bacterium]MBX3108588.1 hypothetical protein [Fimbriimonadaceae bacterium]